MANPYGGDVASSRFKNQQQKRKALLQNREDSKKTRLKAWRKRMKKLGYTTDATNTAYNANGTEVGTFEGGMKKSLKIKKTDKPVVKKKDKPKPEVKKTETPKTEVKKTETETKTEQPKTEVKKTEPPKKQEALKIKPKRFISDPRKAGRKYSVRSAQGQRLANKLKARERAKEMARKRKEKKKV